MSTWFHFFQGKRKNWLCTPRVKRQLFYSFYCWYILPISELQQIVVSKPCRNLKILTDFARLFTAVVNSCEVFGKIIYTMLYSTLRKTPNLKCSYWKQQVWWSYNIFFLCFPVFPLFRKSASCHPYDFTL